MLFPILCMPKAPRENPPENREQSDESSKKSPERREDPRRSGERSEEQPPAKEAREQNATTVRMDKRVARDDAMEVLEDIEDAMSELLQKGLEHRVEDVRDVIPILCNIRSHKLATREAQIIGLVRQDAAELEGLVQKHGIALDLTEFNKVVKSIGKPGGVTKILATILPGFRAFHRGFAAPKIEKLKMIVSNLQREVRERRREVRAAA